MSFRPNIRSATENMSGEISSMYEISPCVKLYCISFYLVDMTAVLFFVISTECSQCNGEYEWRNLPRTMLSCRPQWRHLLRMGFVRGGFLHAQLPLCYGCLVEMTVFFSFRQFCFLGLLKIHSTMYCIVIYFVLYLQNNY